MYCQLNSSVLSFIGVYSMPRQGVKGIVFYPSKAVYAIIERQAKSQGITLSKYVSQSLEKSLELNVVNDFAEHESRLNKIEKALRQQGIDL